MEAPISANRLKIIVGQDDSGTTWTPGSWPWSPLPTWESVLNGDSMGG